MLGFLSNVSSRHLLVRDDWRPLMRHGKSLGPASSLGRLALRPRVVIDDEPRDRMPRRQTRQRVARKPPRVLELLGVDDEIAAGIGGDETDHHLAREGPVLAADVADVLHVDADLFLDLARDTAFERLPIVDEARDERVAIRRPTGLAREEHALTIADEHDRRRVQVGIVLIATARTLLAPLALDALGGFAAAGAVAARRFPPERLH